MQSFKVPDNQTVSWCIWWASIIREADVTLEDAEEYRTQMMRCFDNGEPIWMGALTLRQYVDCNKGKINEKTPLQLARRVVRF
jgi:hypothetical protein